MEPIHDHALIGDCRAAALVSWRGAIDWLCWPRFDSPSVFVALLDEKAGHWTLQPTAPFESTQRYLDGTNIIELHGAVPLVPQHQLLPGRRSRFGRLRQRALAEATPEGAP